MWRKLTGGFSFGDVSSDSEVPREQDGPCSSKIKIAISLASRMRMLNSIVCLIDPNLVGVNPSGVIEMKARLNGRCQIRLQRKLDLAIVGETMERGIMQI